MIRKYASSNLHQRFTFLINNDHFRDHYIKKYKKHILKQGGEVLGENINYILQPQVSFVLMDQKTGHVLALVGGRGK